MGTEQFVAKSHEQNIAVNWDDAHRYTPTSRHRRRLLLRIISDLGFRTILDAGCAQPYLLQEIVHRYKVQGFGCDISDDVMLENQRTVPECQFLALDLSRERWPDDQQFDLVVCSEVLEHIEDWQAALHHIVQMTNRHLLITVPGGQLRPVEQMLGHYRHYQGPELLAALEENGCEVVKVRRWGFPMYNWYKALISKVTPDKLYESFCSGQHRYTTSQKLISHLLYALFYINELFDSGDQLIVLARRRLHTDPEGHAT